jgi:hypothetical protein
MEVSLGLTEEQIVNEHNRSTGNCLYSKLCFQNVVLLLLRTVKFCFFTIIITYNE